MPDVLPAQAGHCGSSVALCSYSGHMANVSITTGHTSRLNQTVNYSTSETIFSPFLD